MDRLIVKYIPPKKCSDDLAKFVGKITGYTKGYGITATSVQMLKNGRSREFGFIGCKDATVAEEILKKLNGVYWENRKLAVAEAKKVTEIDLNISSSRHSRKKAVRLKDGREGKISKQMLKIKEAKEKYLYISKRIFVENIPYDSREEDICLYFTKFAPVVSVTMVKCEVTGSFIGKCIIEYSNNLNVQDACKTEEVFQGRVLHIYPAQPQKKEAKKDEDDLNAGSSYKNKQLKRIEASASDPTSWNLLFTSASQSTKVMSKDLGVDRSVLLGLEDDHHLRRDDGSTAAKAALAETYLVQEVKTWLDTHGISADAFNRSSKDPLSEGDYERSNDTLVVKHLPDNINEEILVNSLSKYGSISDVSLCPTGTLALVKFNNPKTAEKTLSKCQMRPLCESKAVLGPIYLEYAPVVKFPEVVEEPEQEEIPNPKQELGESNLNNLTHPKLLVRNIAFQATADDITPLFEAFGTVVNCRLPKNREGRIRGFAFIEMSTISEADHCMTNLSSTHLYGRRLVIEPAKEDATNLVKRPKTE